ncbi:MAG: bifunctional DNA-formamidopyrimidine glycosylase/DNA-(apurinic or apyrimidinic site) lyase [Neisseria sp.]|nr:bifunctional DNA-formamidopyrimidine glycosylase/DNA-(apurinic or apyrimidinic site) lyase [Neisseria sp.]
MPELPEVETTLRGVAPHIQGKTVARVQIRQPKLRWPVPSDLPETLQDETVVACERRAKYLIIRFASGIVLIHLGMSGSLRVFSDGLAPEAGKHDHLDMVFSDGTVLRYHDPRRFGAVLWYAGAQETHPLLADLGPEPLENGFDGAYLYAQLKKRKSPVKTVLMDNKVVVGVGNIYANESLFASGIAPQRRADKINKREAALLAEEIRAVLHRAIEKGGSTLRDFVDSEGNSGYFQQEYKVYGRNGEPCRACGTEIVKTVIGQRGTFYCPKCQK